MYQMYHNLSSTDQCQPALPGLLPARRFIWNQCMWWYTRHCICLHLQVEDPMHCAHSRKHSHCHVQNAFNAIMQRHKQQARIFPHQNSTHVYNSLPTHWTSSGSLLHSTTFRNKIASSSTNHPCTESNLISSYWKLISAAGASPISSTFLSPENRERHRGTRRTGEQKKTTGAEQRLFGG